MPIQSLIAGAPSVEILEAYVHEVKEIPTGFALVVSGDIVIGTVSGLKADHAILTQPFGNPAFHIEDKGKYEERLRSYVGKKVAVQVWGDILTIESGRVTKIYGGQVHPLYPTNEERGVEVHETEQSKKNANNSEQATPRKPSD